MNSSSPQFRPSILICTSIFFILSFLTINSAYSLQQQSTNNLPISSDTEEKIAARMELARVLSYQKKYAEAEAEYRALLNEFPHRKDIKLDLARMLVWAGKPGEAESLLSNEKELPPEAMLIMGDACYQKGDFKGAAEAYTRYLNLSPDDLAARLRLADSLAWTKNYDDALTNYERILDKRKDDAEVRRKYGMCLSWAGYYEKAAEELKKSLGQ